MNRKVEQGEATRAVLVDAAVTLFTEKGFAGTSTTEIVRRADVTRGALYHHFADKEELFRAAYEAVQHDIFDRCASAGGEDPVARLKAGIAAYLDACREPAVRRILLTEGPLVLGWERSLTFDDPYCPRRLLRAAVHGLVPDRPPEPLAHLLFGALQQAGLVIAGSPGRHGEMVRAMDAMIDSLFETS